MDWKKRRNARLTNEIIILYTFSSVERVRCDFAVATPHAQDRNDKQTVEKTGRVTGGKSGSIQAKIVPKPKLCHACDKAGS